MQLMLSVVTGFGEPTRDVSLDIPDDGTVGDAATALAELLHPAGTAGLGRRCGEPETMFGPPGVGGAGLVPQAGTPGGIATGALWSDGRALPADQPARNVLLDGQLVSLDPALAPATRLVEPQGAVELRIAGGPSAGLVARLPLGSATVGSGPGCTVVVTDGAMPPEALRLDISPTGVTVTPTRPGTTVLENSALDVGVPAPWPAGGIVACGTTLLTVQVPNRPDAFLSAADDGGLAYNRPPRILPPPGRQKLTRPHLPPGPEKARLMLAASLAPMLMGLASYFFFKSAYMLLFCALTPIVMIVEYFSNSRYGKKKRRTEVRNYREKLAEYERNLEELRLDDRYRRRRDFPDPGDVLMIATGPRGRLWERRHDDPDALVLRLGSAHQPAHIEIIDPEARSGDAPVEPPTVEYVPAVVPLREVGVLGLAGARHSMLGLLRWLVAQAAVLHSPRELSLVVLAPGEEAGAPWNWLRWLPHTAPRDGQQCRVLVGSNAETVSRRVAELVAEIERRMRAREGSGTVTSALHRDPSIVVVLDGAQALRRVGGVPQLLVDGPKVGVYALCLDREERLLPEECRVVAADDTENLAAVLLRGGGLERLGGPVLADRVAVPWSERISRALAPVRDVSRDDGDSSLPSSARLLELIRMPDPMPERVSGFWAATGGRTTRVPIGYGPEGAYEVDISKDGPHALVAGTTGAGKSELLQSLITSLAVANRPDTLNFVLIDYKGGSAFLDCSRLPHTVGMVSDLDAHLTERALESLAAELRRREEVLLAAEAKDMEDYWDTKALRPELEPVPRLVLIIDEFASLVAELPDFVAGLVDIARRGRSLGVHLILATQRPAGVVSDDIRANTNLRIALRVTSPDESNDVIDAADAATISKSTPGRCYVRSGASALRPVQTARIGGRRPDAEDDVESGAEASALDWRDLGFPETVRAPVGRSLSTMDTDLSVLVEAIAGAARAEELDEQRRPWLPPLPEAVTLDEVVGGLPGMGEVERTADDKDEVRTESSAELADVPIGLIDFPARQAQLPLTFSPSGNGHVLIAGSPRVGRTTALRTLAGSLAARNSPADLHIYALDCGTGGLLPLAALPHCGAVVTRDQTDRVDRLLTRLQSEVARRQDLLAEKGYSSVAEQRRAVRPEDRLPWMVLLLDQWDGFHTVFENYDFGRLIDAALRLLREGGSAGLRAVVTSDRSALAGQVSSAFEDRLLMRMANPEDLTMAGVNSKQIPGSMADGRALQIGQRGLLEAQFALLSSDGSGPAQIAALQKIGREAQASHGRPPRPLRPLRVDALPRRLSFDQLLALDPQFVSPGPLFVALGAGGDELLPQGVDLTDDAPGVVIAGPSRSGRSTVLVNGIRQLTGNGVPVLVVAPRRSPLRKLAGADGVIDVLTLDASSSDLEEALEGKERYVVVVDDAELLEDHGIADALENVLAEARDEERGLLIAGDAEAMGSQYRGFVAQARRGKCGLILSPSGGEGDLFDVRLPRNAGGGPPGRALLVRHGRLTGVQAPTE